MDLAGLTAKADEALKSTDEFNKTLKLDFGSFGRLFLDGVNNEASNEDKPADATVSVTWEDFKKLAKRELDPTRAMMTGKLKIAGDMGVVMSLQNLISNFA